VASEPQDQRGRDRIREALDRNLVVEAAAGTGKTTSLIARMVALVGAGTPVERICAVTFTIKAAAQLDQRFQNALEAAAREETDPARRRRFEDALGRLDACFIGTIHAFCARLLRERPVEAGLDPGFQEMDETADSAARGDAWKRYTERLFSEGSPVLGRLLSAGVRLEDLRETYELLCEHTDVLPVVAPESGPPHASLSLVRPRLEAYLDRVVPELPASVPLAGWDNFQRAVRAASRLRRLVDMQSVPELVSVLQALDRASKPDSKSWPDRAKAARVWDEFEVFRQDVLAPALRAWREYLHPIAIGAISPAVEEYAAWRRREGRVNFQDQLLCARNLLRDHPSVRRGLQERFTPVLVDEFQDTDPIQAEVLLYLTGRETEEKDWRKLTPVPGSLFVVGDPKQSIYRFRRADIQTYEAVSEIVARAGGEIVRLSTNFRSTEEICSWANRVFDEIFPDRATPAQAAHVPLVPFEHSGQKGPGIFRLEIPSQKRAADVAAFDAEAIAKAIAGALAGRPPLAAPGTARPGDFLIVSRRRLHLACYARALEARGIPYEIAGGGAFRDSDEIETLWTALEAVADPENPVPLVATLRGSLFGVDDEALYHFQRSGGRFDFRSVLPQNADPRIATAYAHLREGSELAQTLPPAAAIARFSERLGWIASAAAGFLGDARAGNLLKAVGAARELSRQRESFPEIVRRLRDLTEEGDVEEMGTRPGRADVVRLMTLHRAKGLEARIVFLADPTDPYPPPPKAWIDRTANPPVGHFLVQRRNGRVTEDIARPIDWDEKCQREKEFLDREGERLLYVAATRAREGLVVSLRRNQTGKIGGPWASFAPHVPRHLPTAGIADSPSSYSGRTEAARALEEFRARRRERFAASAAPSYATASVTALAHAAGQPRPFAVATGRGMSWGSVLHRVLEASMRDPSLDLEAYAANVLAEEDRPALDLPEVLRTVAGVRESDLWKRALRARRCLVEVPFALPVDSTELGLRPSPAITVLQGAIDLVFEEEDGWVLIDYKSDTIDGNRDALLEFYEPQIVQYQRRWRTLTGRETRAGLYFIQTGETVWIPE
jgi:ATP-dependent helicase/nuclease subunit A